MASEKMSTISLDDAKSLGKGGMGETYLVNVMGSQGVQQFVFKKALSSSPGGKKAELSVALEREKDVLLDGKVCPHVPGAQADMRTDSVGDIGFLQEYLPGSMDLRHAVEDTDVKGFTSPYLSVMVEDLLDTLKCLHERGIVHNDVKPDNILVRVENNRLEPRVYRLIDFGASCYVEGDLKKSRTCGCDRLSDPSTTLFLSPESYLALWQMFVSDIQQKSTEAGSWVQSLGEWASTPREKCVDKKMLVASDLWALAMSVLYVCVMTSGNDYAMWFWQTYEAKAAKSIPNNIEYGNSIRQMYRAYDFFFTKLPGVLEIIAEKRSLSLATYLRDALHPDPNHRKNRRLTEGVTASTGLRKSVNGRKKKGVRTLKASVAEYNPLLQEFVNKYVQDGMSHAAALHKDGVVYYDQGKFEEALKQYQQALNIYERVGKHSKDVAATLYNIGMVLDDQGKFEEALEHYRRSLEIKERVFGKDSKDVAATLHNIGIVYYNQGKFEEALKQYQQALNIYERLFGKDSKDVAETLYNIGMVYKEQGKFEEALHQYQQALEIEERVFGNDSKDVVKTLHEIGMVYYNQDKFEEALDHYRRVLKIKERVFGKDSKDVAATLNNIGMVLDDQGKFEEALEHYRRSLEIKEKVFGKDSKNVVVTLHNIAMVLDDQGKFEEALEHYRRVLEIEERVFGKDSKNVAETLHNIGMVHKKQGNFEEALQQYQRALEIKKQLFGKDSKDVAETLRYIKYLKNKRTIKKDNDNARKKQRMRVSRLRRNQFHACQ